MIRCLICNQSYSRRDALQRHERNVHGSGKYTNQSQPLNEMTFRHPFSIMLTGPSGLRKMEWTRKLLLSLLVQPPPEGILWCFGQWQPLNEDLQKRIPCIEFIRGIPDYLDNTQFIDPSKRNLIIFDDLMTEAKCDMRIAYLFTKGSHHRNIFIVYLTQNAFPQGRACRDIALNTQYLVLFNKLIDRQQVATLARRIYLSTSVTFMRKFEDGTARPYSYIVLDLKSSTFKQGRLQTDIFDSVNQQSPDDEDISDDEDADRVMSLDYICSISPPGKERDESYKPDIWNTRISDLSPPGKQRKLRDKRSKPYIWNRRFQNPIRQKKVEQFKAKVNAYVERGFSSDKAIHLAANDDLPFRCKRLRQDYAQFLIDYYELQEDPVQQRILELAKTFKNQHDMNQAYSIRQAIKIRKDLFMDVWPNHNIETEKASEDQEDSTTS